jgi:branched-chain amino acid transport system permease protein
MRRALPFIAGAALVALPFVYHAPYPLHILVMILIWSFAYTSWSMMGRFGLVSLGHGGFMGIGAYVTALLWNHAGVSPWLGIPVALVASGVLAVVVAYPCFRFPRATGQAARSATHRSATREAASSTRSSSTARQPGT